MSPLPSNTSWIFFWISGRQVCLIFTEIFLNYIFIFTADNIDTALGGYFKRESLGQGENMYKCEKCKQKVPATKQYKIERPPMVLCIQLKRFNLTGGKNGRPVTLAKKINISNHVRSGLNYFLYIYF